MAVPLLMMQTTRGLHGGGYGGGPDPFDVLIVAVSIAVLTLAAVFVGIVLFA